MRKFLLWAVAGGLSLFGGADSAADGTGGGTSRDPLAALNLIKDPDVPLRFPHDAKRADGFRDRCVRYLLDLLGLTRQ